MRKKYRIVFIFEDEENKRLVELPILPDKISVKRNMDSSEKTVLELGNVNILKGTKLRQISFGSFFPKNAIPSVSARKQYEPMWYVEKFRKAMESRKPIRFLMIGADLDINTQMSVESFEYSESYGAVGDIDYKLTLKEWVDYSPRKVTIQQTERAAVPIATTSAPDRSGTPPTAPKEDKSVKYTVKRGDTMWLICHNNYGNGNLYPKLYAANKEVMDARNKGTGNPRYTIYVGEVLTLPPKEELK